MACPATMGARSTVVEDSASTSAAGFMLSIIGQAIAPAPTAAPAPATSLRKSRFVTSAPPVCGATWGAVALSAMRDLE
jgi:hypothetical protein